MSSHQERRSYGMARGTGIARGTVLAALVLTTFAARLAANTPCVTNLGDSSVANSGSLRACIAAANTANDGQVINFNPSLIGGTITVATPLIISASMTISGFGANLLTISGGNNTFIFYVQAGASPVAISGVTLADGNSGVAAIQNEATLTVNNVTFTGNNAGAIANSAASLTVTNSTFFGNRADEGGGINVTFGTAVVTNSTFYGNSASISGGAIYNSQGTLTVNNSTISGNSGGGIVNVDGGVTLNDSIVSGNTGGDCTNCGAQTSTNLIGGAPQLAPLGWYGGSTQTMLPLPGSPAIAMGAAAAMNPTNMDQRGFARATTGTIDLGAVQTNYELVTTTQDLVDMTPDCTSGTGSTCSLRDALTLAASGGTDIAFVSGLAGGIINLLDSSLPAISGNLDLVGPGANLLTVSGGGSTAVGTIFNVTSSNAAISGVTIANGNNGQFGLGGGIHNNLNATLTVNNSAFYGNYAGNGGGLCNDGTLAVYNSTFSGNSAGFGGGLFSGTPMVVFYSTFSGNSAPSGGAGIYNAESTLAITNSTFSGNTSGPNNGGGIAGMDGTLTVNNSILTNDPGGECMVIGGNGGCPVNASNGNIVDPTPAQPNLSQLGWYGGPTQTMLPLPGSEAVCAGSLALFPIGFSTDQRGFANTNIASGCLDAGAVQTNFLIVTTSDDVLHTQPCSPCSLRDQLLTASAPGADIAFASNVTGTIDLSTIDTRLPAITGNLDLFGPGANILTVSGGKSSRVGSIFSVNSGANAAISGVTIANGNAAGGCAPVKATRMKSNCAGPNGIILEGGGILNKGSLTVSNSVLSGNTALAGGGISNQGPLTVFNSTFSLNIAQTSGGGGIISAGPLTVIDSTFSGNSALFGGGIDSNSATVLNSTFSGNTVNSIGGGILLAAGTLTLTNSIVAGNTANGVLGSDDCDSCGKQSPYNLIGGVPQLAGLGSYGGPLPTMLPLPGSPAICAGSAALDPGFLLTDERGFPRLNTSYTGFSASTPCLDLGADQTDYQVQFANSSYTGKAGVAVSTPAAPVVSVIDNGQNIGGVPLTLGFMGKQPTSSSGLGPVNTVAGTGATFNALEVSPGGSYTLLASLAITPSINVSNTAGLNIASPAKVTSLTSTTANGTYTTGATINITVHFSHPVTVTGTPQLALNSGGTATYASGSPGTALLFTYTVASPQYTLALDASSQTALTLNGGTIDAAGNSPANLTLPKPGATGSLSANSAIVINAIQYQLTTSVLPAGGGTVAANPTSTQNVTPPLSAGTYLKGSSVQLTATANAGYSFSYWTQSRIFTVNGIPVITANPLTITINSSITETAHFVAASTISKAFSPTTILVGGTSTLSFTINNPNMSQSQSGIFFKDMFPAGMQVAAVPNATNTCGGTFTAPAGATVVRLNGGTLAANSSCTLSVLVKGTMAGMLPNTTSQIVSTPGGTGATSNTATLTVNNPITLVQAASRDAGAVASTSLAFPSANTAGNFIAVVVRAGIANETITVQDSAHNMYLKAVQLAAGGSPGGENLSIFYAQNIAGGANTVMISQTTPGTLRFAILEYSGVATSNALDQTSSAQGRSAAPNAGGVTTTTSGDLLLAGILTVDPEIYTPGTGYTAEAVIPGEPNTKLLVEQRIQLTAGPAGGGATLGSSDPWAAVLAAFHPASNQCVPAPLNASAGNAVANPTCTTGPLR